MRQPSVLQSSNLVVPRAIRVDAEEPSQEWCQGKFVGAGPRAFARFDWCIADALDPEHAERPWSRGGT